MIEVPQWVKDEDRSEIDTGDDRPLNREEEWREGRHHTADGDVWLLKKMTIEHLRYVIRFFKNMDTSALQKELDRKLKLINKNKN